VEKLINDAKSIKIMATLKEIEVRIQSMKIVCYNAERQG
jgi:hypothetical protein